LKEGCGRLSIKEFHEKKIRELYWKEAFRRTFTGDHSPKRSLGNHTMRAFRSTSDNSNPI